MMTIKVVARDDVNDDNVCCSFDQLSFISGI